MNAAVEPLRFLVVEDEALIAMDIISLIEDGGHVVVAEAASLREVQKMSGTLSFDIALVDVQLAEKSSGVDVAAHLEAQFPGSIVVFVTANPKAIPGEPAIAHGVIPKPFSDNGLRLALEYLEQGVRNPPPDLPLPGSFKPFPALAAIFRT